MAAYDKERHNALALKKQAGSLTAEEEEELKILQGKKKQLDLVKIINGQNK